jgi:hypothetical protein
VVTLRFPPPAVKSDGADASAGAGADAGVLRLPATFKSVVLPVPGVVRLPATIKSVVRAEAEVEVDADADADADGDADGRWRCQYLMAVPTPDGG